MSLDFNDLSSAGSAHFQTAGPAKENARSLSEERRLERVTDLPVYTGTGI